MTDRDDTETPRETYIDPCPKCGARLVGLSKAEFVEHLRQNDEKLAARIWDELVVEETPPTDDGLRRRNCADATGYQRETCPSCDTETRHRVWVLVGENGDISYKQCQECGEEWKEMWC